MTYINCFFPETIVVSCAERPVLNKIPNQTAEIPIYSPNLSLDLIADLPGVLNSNDLLREQIGSQGFFVSDDGSCAYSHESSVPYHYYLSPKGADLPFIGCFVNMDRGGITCRADGTFAACIADGAGGRGYFSAFLAQMICNGFMELLSKESVGFTEDQDRNKTITKNLFKEIAFDFLKYDSSHDAASTALFAECVSAGHAVSGKKKYQLHFGSIGDSAIIHVNNATKKAKQLNTIERDLDEFGQPDCTSAGGSIWLGSIRESRKIDASRLEISEDDHVILVTDGFLDNVGDGRIDELVETVIYEPFFDQSFDMLTKYDRFWEDEEYAFLPTVEQMKEFIDKNKSGQLLDTNPTAEQITKRLWNYTKLVTFNRSRQEDLFYQEKKFCHPYGNYTPKTDDAMIITISPAKKRWY